MNKVLVKQPVLHGRITDMVQADVIKADGDTLTVKLGQKTFQVKKSDTLPLQGAGNTRIIQQPSPARGSFSNNKH